MRNPAMGGIVARWRGRPDEQPNIGDAMKMMACIIDEEMCLVRSVCPVCGTVFGVPDFTWEYWQYLETGPAVERYPGWDDAYDLCCDECLSLADAMFGDGFMQQLNKEGALEVVEPLCKLARQLHCAANE